MSENLNIQPFRAHYNVWVECMDGERLDDTESETEARARIVEEIRKGFKQTDFLVEWDVESGDVEPLNERGETVEDAGEPEIVGERP